MDGRVSSSLDSLRDQLLEAESIGSAFRLVAGDGDPPAWVHVFCRQVEAALVAFDALERSLIETSPGGDLGSSRPVSLVQK